MFETRIDARMDDCTDFSVFVHGGQWIADECVFEFDVPEFGLAGVIRCDWREEQPRFDLIDGSLQEPREMRVLQYIANHLRGFHSGAFESIADEDLEALYAAEYHESTSYSAGLESERTRKERMARLVLECTNATKVLVAGCSAGETVRQLRKLGVEAWGFDICPDLDSIAYEEVRPYVRQGSITDIPFGPEDGFDAVTAFDLFEHVPEDRVPTAIGELRRLGFEHVAALIAHCEFEYTGHVTLRPLSWWDARFAPHFARVPTHGLAHTWPNVNDGGRANALLRFYRAVPS